MLSNNYLSDMNVNLNNMKTLQQQMSSGKNFRRASDDPFNVARAMQMHSQINTNKQYNTNITNVINWMDTTDTALGQLGNVFQSVREKLVSAGNAAYGSDEREKIKDEINQRVGQLAQILNTNFDGEYIFGGTKGSTKPVDVKQEFMLPDSLNQSNLKGGKATFINSSYSGQDNANYTVRIKSVDETTGKVTEAQYKINDEAWTDATVNADGNIDIGRGLNINIETNTENKGDTNSSALDGDTYSFTLNKNTKLIYCKDNGEEMSTEAAQSEPITDTSSWGTKVIKFSINQKEYTLDPLGTTNNIDDIYKELNDKINKVSDSATPPNYPLKDKIKIEITSDNRISFKSLTSDRIKISSITPSIPEGKSIVGIEFPSTQFDMISSGRQTEISQGVLVKYNVSVTDIINYEGKDGSKVNIRELLRKIITHLDSNNNNDIQMLTNEDLENLDAAMSQILKVRSEVGAKQNRMESAKDQNEQANLDMTDILSKTEDVDITEKTMEYATMQTVYLAALQTSAKVLQPTLMDYMR